MSELVENSGFQEFTPDMLKTQEGVNILNSLLRQLVVSSPSDFENVRIFKGYGTPEAVVTAGISSLYMRLDGAAGTTTYQKQSGTGNTGWVAVPGGSGSYSLTVEEQDGSPSVSSVNKIKFPNGTVTDNTGGVVSVTVGTGDVVGPATATDNAITRFDTTSGKLIQNSNVKLLDTDIIDIPLTTVGSAGGILMESTSAFGSAHPVFLQHKGSADERLNIYNNLNVQDQVVFSESGTTNPHMLLGNTSSGLFAINGNYSATPASLRMITNYIWEFTKYLFCTAMSVGSGNVTTLTAAPTDGMLVQGYISEQSSYRVLDQDFPAVTTTTLAKVAGASGPATLEVTLTSGKWYTFSAVLFVDTSVAGGHKYDISGTATATSIIYNLNSIRNSTSLYVLTSRQTALASAVGEVSGTAYYTEINGTIKCNAGGSFYIRFAQNVANGTSTVLKGSSLIVKEVFV